MSGSKNRTKEVVKKIRHIQKESENKGKGASKYITDRCNAIASSEHERLGVEIDHKTGELTSEPNCSYRYYSQLMEDYRSGVKALGFKHHAIDYHIKAFYRKYLDKKPEISKMLDPALTIQELRNNLILLRSDSITGSEFRHDLLNLKIEHHAYYMFEPKGAIKDWIRDDDKKQLTKKLHSQILINPKWVSDFARDLLVRQTPSDSDLCIGIALATGRRLTEVMKTAVLKKVDDKTLLFGGQLKTKNRHLFEEITPYQIPSMVDADIVVKALKKLRRNTGKDQLNYTNALGEDVKKTVADGDIKDYYHNRAVHKRYESTINRGMRAELQNGYFSLKDCRALYTEVTYEEHSQDGESRSAYRHRVLGHSLIETQLHYEAFQLDKTVEKFKLIDDDSDDEPMTDLQSALINYLEMADANVQDYTRAPKIAIMHEWLKSEVANGLDFDKITPSYIRRYCLFDGKQLNLNTIKKYVAEFIQLDQFKPPQEKAIEPTDKKGRELFEIKQLIEEIKKDSADIADEREELNDELIELEDRLEDIHFENKSLEKQEKLLNENLGKLLAKLEKLQVGEENK